MTQIFEHIKSPFKSVGKKNNSIEKCTKHMKGGRKIAKEDIKIFLFLSYQSSNDFKVILRSREDVFLILGILIHLHKLLNWLIF